LVPIERVAESVQISGARSALLDLEPINAAAALTVIIAGFCGRALGPNDLGNIDWLKD
jgi:hypothetical protein